MPGGPLLALWRAASGGAAALRPALSARLRGRLPGGRGGAPAAARALSSSSAADAAAAAGAGRRRR